MIYNNAVCVFLLFDDFCRRRCCCSCVEIHIKEYSCNNSDISYSSQKLFCVSPFPQKKQKKEKLVVEKKIKKKIQGSI